MNRYKGLEALDIEFQEAESAWLEAKDDQVFSDQQKANYLDRLHRCLEKRRAHITKHWHDPVYPWRLELVALGFYAAS